MWLRSQTWAHDSQFLIRSGDGNGDRDGEGEGAYAMDQLRLLQLLLVMSEAISQNNL